VLQSTEYRHYRTAVLFSLLLSFLVAVFLFIYGKEHSFHTINRYNHRAFDYIFEYWTYLGHGMIWVPLILYSLIYKRDFLIALLIAGIICALLTQGGKRFIFPDELRPVLAIGKEKIRIVEGITPHTNNSFPSGHTSTAFTLALLAAYIVRGKFWMYFFPLVAFFVGYSRVYLAHHFVSDVFAGMLIGIISSYIALLAYQKFRTRKAERKLEERALKKQTE
jgi:membrane-associated phospholipid phosphatase